MRVGNAELRGELGELAVFAFDCGACFGGAAGWPSPRGVVDVSARDVDGGVSASGFAEVFVGAGECVDAVVVGCVGERGDFVEELSAVAATTCARTSLPPVGRSL